MEIELKKLFKREIKNNRLQKQENKNIMNIFLNNIKETKAEIIQTRALPNISVVPALLNKLPDTINNIIFHYVGYKSKTARWINRAFKDTLQNEFEKGWPLHQINVQRSILYDRQNHIDRYILKLYEALR